MKAPHLWVIPRDCITLVCVYEQSVVPCTIPGSSTESPVMKFGSIMAVRAGGKRLTWAWGQSYNPPCPELKGKAHFCRTSWKVKGVSRSVSEEQLGPLWCYILCTKSEQVKISVLGDETGFTKGQGNIIWCPLIEGRGSSPVLPLTSRVSETRCQAKGPEGQPCVWLLRVEIRFMFPLYASHICEDDKWCLQWKGLWVAGGSCR